MAAYHRYRDERYASEYIDAEGNYPFRKSDGSGDVVLYRKNINQQRKRDDAVSALLKLSVI